MRRMTKNFMVALFAVLFGMPAMAFASAVNPSDLDDTIQAEPRCDKYYYTKWFDDCPNWRPKGVWDSCFCFKYEFGRLFSGKLAKWEYAHNKRMKVKGLAAMVNAYTPPTVDTAAWNPKNPEYLYIYQMTAAGHRVYQEIDDTVRLQLLDSVRWDTATARVMEFRQGWNDEYIQYCYLYEAYFDQPVWVDSDFYIVGSMNTPNSGGKVSTFYVDVMDWGYYMLNEKNGCTVNNYGDLLYCWGPSVLQCPQCLGEGRPYAFWDNWFSPALGGVWMSDWPLSPVGYYLVIVDKWDLNAVPNEEGWGEVLGGGRFPDESDDTITAVAAPGFAFVSWSDGVTDNPRVVHLMSDTTLIANFQCTQQFNLQVIAADDAMGSVTGGGSYYAADITIAATPAIGHKFSHWNDSITDNPRIVHLVSDTTFVAYFEDISDQTFTLQVTSANEAMGTVSGGGTYYGGTNHTITATCFENWFMFSHWNDGVTDNPREVYLVSDTAFVAFFDAKPQYTVQTAANNDAWGTVTGGGVYYEGEEATLTAVPTIYHAFEGWSDGEQLSPRTVTVTQDTMFTALFSVDSSNSITRPGALDFTVSPNPTTGHLTIRMNQPEEYEMMLFDVNGKALLGNRSREEALELDISNLPAGQYLLVLRTKERQGIRTIVKK